MIDGTSGSGTTPKLADRRARRRRQTRQGGEVRRPVGAVIQHAGAAQDPPARTRPLGVQAGERPQDAHGVLALLHATHREHQRTRAVHSAPPGLLAIEVARLEALGGDAVTHAGDGHTESAPGVAGGGVADRELLHEVAAGRFRQDLYYRLAVYPIAVPPLRARKDDLPLLAAHLLARICRSLHRPMLRLTPEQLALLAAHDWPGNVRELRNVLERAVISAGQGDAQVRLALDEERPARRPIPMFAPPAAVPALEGPPLTAVPVEPAVLSAAEMRRRDRQNLLAAVASCHGKIYGPDGAAALLGMKPTTLASRLKRLHG
jgi:hypothetical protein